MNILQFLRIFWARRTLVLTAAICAVIGGFVVAKLVPPRYEATARVMFNFTKPDPITGETLNPNGAGAYFNTQTEMVRDYRVAAKVVDAFNWQSDPYWISTYNARPSSDTRDFRHWLAQRVSDDTTPSIDGTVLEIKYKSNSALAAKTGAEVLRQAYLDQSLSDRRAYAARNAAWYAEQAQAARRDADAAELAKASFEKQNGIVMSGDNDLDSQRLAALANSAAVPTGSAAAPMASSSASLQLAQLDANIAQAARELGPNHPQLQQLRQQRSLVAGVVAREEAAARAVASGETGAAAIGRALQAQKARVISERDKIERLRQLQAEVDLRRDQYKRTAARAAELGLESAVADSGMTPLGVVVAPSHPSFPNKPLMVGGAGALGLALGLALALLLELLNRRVRSPEDLNLGADFACIAVIQEPARPRETLMARTRRLGRLRVFGANA